MITSVASTASLAFGKVCKWDVQNTHFLQLCKFILIYKMGRLLKWLKMSARFMHGWQIVLEMLIFLTGWPLWKKNILRDTFAVGPFAPPISPFVLNILREWLFDQENKQNYSRWLFLPRKAEITSLVACAFPRSCLKKGLSPLPWGEMLADQTATFLGKIRVYQKRHNSSATGTARCHLWVQTHKQHSVWEHKACVFRQKPPWRMLDPLRESNVRSWAIILYPNTIKTIQKNQHVPRTNIIAVKFAKQG